MDFGQGKLSKEKKEVGESEKNLGRGRWCRVQSRGADYKGVIRGWWLGTDCAHVDACDPNLYLVILPLLPTLHPY